MYCYLFNDVFNINKIMDSPIAILIYLIIIYLIIRLGGPVE